MPDPYLSPGRVGLARAPCAGVSGRVFFGLGRVFWPLGRVFRVGSGFGSKITARARPVDCCGSKNTARAHPPRSSGRVGSGFFRTGWVGLFGSGDPCPGLATWGGGLLFIYRKMWMVPITQLTTAHNCSAVNTIAQPTTQGLYWHASCIHRSTTVNKTQRAIVSLCRWAGILFIFSFNLC